MGSSIEQWWPDFELIAQYSPTDADVQALIDAQPDQSTKTTIHHAWSNYKSCFAEKGNPTQCLQQIKEGLTESEGESAGKAKPGEVNEKDFRRAMRPFVPPLELRGMFGVGNSTLKERDSVTGTTTTVQALHECNPDEGHFDLSERCREFIERDRRESEEGGGGNDWHFEFDGPNQLLFGIALAGDLLNLAPNRLVPVDGRPGRFEIEETGHQLYWMAELGIWAFLFQDGTGQRSAADLGVGWGYRTDLTKVFDGENSTVVLFPGIEALAALSTIHAGENGSAMALRLLLPAWFSENWGLQSFVQFGIHKWGSESMANNRLTISMYRDNTTPVFGIMARRTLVPPKTPRTVEMEETERVVYLPAETAECPDIPPQTIVRGMVISLPDLNFVTNQPTDQQMINYAHFLDGNNWKAQIPWSVAGLRQALGELIFDPLEYNLRVLERIAERLNEPDLADFVIHIVGHTDGRGEEGDNASLSERRAHIVKNLLILLGVDEGRLVAEARGETEPKIAEDPTLDPGSLDKAQGTNRRIEFRLGDKIR